MKKRIGYIVLSIVTVASLCFIMYVMYKVGQYDGREETINMINELADEYTFKHITCDDDGWNLAGGKGGIPYSDWDDTLCYEYNRDYDGKIHLGYNEFR